MRIEACKPLSRPIFCTVETKQCMLLALYVCRAPTMSSHFLKREIVPDRFGPLHRVWPASWMPIIWSCVLADVRGIWMQRTQYLDDYRAAFVVIFRPDREPEACHYTHAGMHMAVYASRFRGNMAVLKTRDSWIFLINLYFIFYFVIFFVIFSNFSRFFNYYKENGVVLYYCKTWWN